MRRNVQWGLEDRVIHIYIYMEKFSGNAKGVVMLII